MEVPASVGQFLLPIVDSMGAFFSEEPLVRTAQFALLAGAGLLIFLVFYTTRDILHRTRSLFYQISCILLVAAVPVAGFLLYLLIRPMRTVKEREMEEKIARILEHVEKKHAPVLPKLFFPSPRIPTFPTHRSLARKELPKKPAPALTSA
jgi:hypothetical protein